MRVGIAFLALLFTSCATYQASPSFEERAYLARVNAAPLSFVLPEADYPLAHDRAEVFASKFSANGLSIVTDRVIESNRPTKDRLGFGYRITFLPIEGGYETSIYCFPGGNSGVYGKFMFRNARILAHYLKTGEIKADFVR